MSKLTPDMSSVTRVGLDLAKNVFQVHAVDAAGAEIDKRAIRRGKLIDYFAGEFRGQYTKLTPPPIRATARQWPVSPASSCPASRIM